MGFEARLFQRLINKRRGGAFSFSTRDSDDFPGTVVKKNLGLGGYFIKAGLRQDFKRDTRRFDDNVIASQLFEVVFIKLLVGDADFFFRE